MVIEDGAIAAVGARGSLEIPRDVPTLDCSGLSIAPGFWNSHVHFFERKWAKAGEIPARELARQLQDAFSRFGFTTVLDTGSAWENTKRIRDRIDSGEVAGPRILSTGEALVALAEQDSRVVAVCNDSIGSSKLSAFATRFPRRLVNVGIAEQNMVGVAAGLANGGKVPYVCAASCFLTARALEQIKAELK